MHNSARAKKARALREKEWFSLSQDERTAWFGFLRTHADVVKALDDDLEAGSGLQLSSFDVLMQLSIASEERLRMHELAEAVVLSRSGLTRLVDRLERDRLVVRKRAERDPRHVFAEITELGLITLARAIPPHLAGVRTRFLSRLSQKQIATLAEIWRTLLPAEDNNQRAVKATTSRAPS